MNYSNSQEFGNIDYLTKYENDNLPFFTFYLIISIFGTFGNKLMKF